MTFGTETLGTISTGNSLTLIDGTNTTAYNYFSGTISSATSLSVVISGSSATDDIYNTHVIEIISGKGKTQSRNIEDYDGTTKTITVSTQWLIIPDTTSMYVIHRNSGIASEQTQVEPDVTIKLKPSESTVDGFFNRTFMKIISGAGVDQIREIIEYTGSTKIARVERPWDIFPDETSLYAIFGESGVCPDQSAAISTTIILDGNQTTAGTAQYMAIEIYSGAGISQFRTISSITTNTLTITEPWDTQPTQNDKYTLFSGCEGVYEKVKDYSTVTITGTADIEHGEKIIIEYESSIDIKGVDHTVGYAESSITFPRKRQLSVVTSKYFRLKIIAMGTTVSSTVQTIYHSRKGGTLALKTEERIHSNSPVRLVRSVTVGKNASGNYKNIAIDSNDNMFVNITNPLSAFGELLTAQLYPIAQINYVFGINSKKIEQFTSHGTYMTVDVEGDVGVALIQSIYFPIASSFTSSGSADYMTLESGAPASYYVWFNVDSGNTDPSPGGTGISVSISASDSPSAVASAAQSAIDSNAAFSATVFGSVVTITNATTGAAKSAHLDNMPNTTNSSITWDKTESAAVITTGTSLADYAVIRSRRALVYRNGQGSDIRFTAVFDTPVEGTEQFVGASNSSAGFYVGYDGTDFQLNRRTHGLHEIRELTISSVASATTGTVFLTIDGIRHTITLTDVSTAQEVATHISQHDYKRGLYLTDTVDNKVIVLSERQNAQTGNHTFSFALGTATNITASWAQISTSSAQTRDTISQTSWNIDRMNGTGPSGQILNPQKGNVFRITFQWLGFGSILFSIEDSNTGKFAPVHVFKYANKNTSVSLSQPTLQYTAYVASTFSVTPISLRLFSCGMFVQGHVRRHDPIYSHSNTHTGLDGINTNKLIMAIRNPRVFNGKGSQVELLLRTLTVATTKSASTARAIVNVYLIADGTPSQNIVFNYKDEGESAVYVASHSYADNITVTGTDILFSTVITSEGASTINLSEHNLLLQKQRTLYVVYSHDDPSGNSVLDLGVDLTWIEDH